MDKRNMKHFVIYASFFIFVCSCTETTKKKEAAESVGKSNMHQTKSDSVAKLFEPEQMDINVQLPFGSPVLVSHKFPKQWENTAYSDTKPSENENLLIEVEQFYYKLNTRKITEPKVSKIEYINLFYPWKFNDSLLKLVDSCQFRLPDMGPYVAYFNYSFTKGPYKEKEGVDFEEHAPYLISYGNLILIDPKTRNAKILNIHANIAAPFSAYARYFYIDNKGKIHIFERSSDEDLYTFKKRYSISIKKNGQIKVEEISKASL